MLCELNSMRIEKRKFFAAAVVVNTADAEKKKYVACCGGAKHKYPTRKTFMQMKL